MSETGPTKREAALYEIVTEQDREIRNLRAVVARPERRVEHQEMAMMDREMDAD